MAGDDLSTTDKVIRINKNKDWSKMEVFDRFSKKLYLFTEYVENSFYNNPFIFLR